MQTKGIVLATAIAAVFLIAAVGSASALPNCPAPGNTVITSSCELNQSWNVPAGQNGYIIGASDVVIDGKGYKITGDVANATCTGDETHPCVTHSGIVNNGAYNNVVIKNLEIEKFCTGVVIGTHGVTVENMTVTGCRIHDCGRTTDITHGIHVVGANNCTITKNEIYNINGSGVADGCAGGGNGIFMHGDKPQSWGIGGDYNNITCNYLHDNNKSGFFMKYMCMYCNISYNNATRNGEGGIVPMCMMSNYNTIEYNNASNNTQWGYFTRGSGNTIRYNTFINNGLEGIAIPAGANNNVYDNCACGNSPSDISITGASNTANNNTCGIIYSESGVSGNGCPWNCDSLVSVYYDFDKDGDCSNKSCDCGNELSVGACCNPGLFNSSGAYDHCAACLCCNTKEGTDPDDCDKSVWGIVPVPTILELLSLMLLSIGLLALVEYVVVLRKRGKD